MAVTLTLVDKRKVVANVWLFTFEPGRPLDWVAGQFIRVELPHAHADAEGASRSFTIASAPYERHIQIATRITQSTFKQALARLPVGGRMRLLDLPAGDFVWPASEARPAVFAAQGIGITPVRSMLRQRLHEGRPVASALVYSNLTRGVPFEAEVGEWAKQPGFELHMLDRPVSADLLGELVPDVGSSVVYVSGPKSLIKLLAPPVNLPIPSLKQDQFPNYATTDY